MNLLPVSRSGGSGGMVEIRSPDLLPLRFDIGSSDLPAELILGFRPQATRVGPVEGAPLAARVEIVEHLGDQTVVNARLSSGTTVLAVMPGDVQVNSGSTVGLSFDPAEAHLFLPSGPRIDFGRAALAAE
jgi:ABC-type sugar transport system ATPase subunit